MKYLILHYFFLVHLCNIKIWAFTKRHRILRNGMYDIDGFIRQLLASDRFDELAEKLAEKAANKIMRIETNQALDQKVSRVNKVKNYIDSVSPNIRSQSGEKHEKENGRNNMEIVKVIEQNTRAQSYAKHEKEYVGRSTEKIKGFIGKIDPQAVMNESSALSENLKLKFKYLKKNLKNQRNPVENVTNEDSSKQNKKIRPTDDEHKNETERLSSNQNGTKLSTQHDVKMESIEENKGLRDYKKDYDQKEVAKMVTINSSTDDVHNENRLKKIYLPKETHFRADPNSGLEDIEQEARHLGKSIIEEHSSSLHGELEKREEVTQKNDTTESNELFKALGYVTNREDNVEENKVPSEYDNPILLHSGGAVFRTGDDSNDSSDRLSIENPPEDQSWNEQVEKTVNKDSPTSGDGDSAKPVLRKEGGKTYTYVQNSDYKEYHEEMAKWRKEHPKNSADFM